MTHTNKVCPPGGQGRMVVIVANLKTKKLGGLPSEGMVLCASSPVGMRERERANITCVDTWIFEKTNEMI